MGTLIAIIIVIALIVWIGPLLLVCGLAALGVYIIYSIYRVIYFKSEKFLTIKNEISEYIVECNELNAHIEDLKRAYVGVDRKDYGKATYTDNSKFNFKRPELKNAANDGNVYECSINVCKSAQQQPFKYLCKYFNIEANEATLSRFENVFNDFSAAENGKVLLEQKRKEIIDGISSRIPFLIRTFSKKKLSAKLGFTQIDFSNLHFPKYTFRYVSGGGNSTMKCDIVLDVDNLERFVGYLAEKVKFAKSVAGQRSLMTSRLREQIKERDNYTCKHCGVSIEDEPHLLLEIDHIIPVSRGGMTTEDNLQTLCWKCNRTKGARLTSSK